MYDTEPVCRAVVAARLLQPHSNALAVFKALQKAFYADGLDTTDREVLVTVVSQALWVQGFATDGWRNASTLRPPGRQPKKILRKFAVGAYPAFPTLGRQGDSVVRLTDGFAKAPHW